MLSFQQQQKILKAILQRETNKNCADCGSHTPTWASLDFGVFVCSNCSGAHRALGPTITRIKSTKLDQWNKEWVENMRIGNLQVNQFWEADSKTATVKKPHSGATLDEHNRYIYDKYMRKKFVIDKTGVDPLRAYKTGKHAYSINDLNQIQKQKTKKIYASFDGEIPSIIGMPKKNSETDIQKKQTFNLLDDFNQANENHKHIPTNIKNNPIQTHNLSKLVEDDQFTDFIDATVNVPAPGQQTQATHQPDSTKLSFDDLFKKSQQNSTNLQHKQPQALSSYPQQNFAWNGLQQNPINIYNHGQINYGNNFYHQPQYINQFSHNPYIGYAPHNSIHASYNMNFFK